MANNIDLQKQLTEVLQEQARILEQQSKSNQNNLSLTKSLVDTIKGVSFSNQTGELSSLNDALEKGSDAVEKYGKTALAAASAMDGFRSGLSLSTNLAKTMASVLFGAGKAIFNLGKSIITAPFKILSSLMQSVTGGSNELQQAIEDVRKEFGNLREATGKATLDMARNLKGQLANTGLSVYRVFGNLAERLRTMMEYMKELGPLAGVLAHQLAGNAEAIGAYHKGLGLTAEGFKAVGNRAHASGEPMTEVLRQMGNYSLQLGKAFGLSSKEISRDMGTMMNDFTHFGHLGVRELAQISTYTRRLGIDFKALGAVMDKFANFEDAAQGAAQLSQAFGLNINAIELMKEQDPARKVEILRKAFFAAGRTVENMTYQERRLLAAQSGVTEENLNLVFSLKNQNLSYAEVQKRGAAAQKSQLSQVQVLHQLSDAIERLVKSGGGGASSFFEIWLKGFKNGITWSRDFRGLMRNLRIDMNSTFIEGRKVGLLFAKQFPGLQAFMSGVRELFNPTQFRMMLQRTTASFKEFFHEMTTDPKTALKHLLEHLKADFFSWFQGNSANGQKILNGMKAFFTAMSHVVAGMLKTAIEGLSSSLTYITDLLSGRKSLSALAAGGRGAGGFLAQLLMPLLDAIKEAGPGLWVSVKALFSVLFEKVKQELGKHWVAIARFMFGPALIGAAVRGAQGFIAGGGAQKAVGALGKAFSRVQNVAQHVPTGGTRGVGGMASEAIGSADQAAQAAERTSINPRALIKLAIITAVLGFGLYLLITQGLVPLAKSIQDNNLTPQSIMSASLTILAASAAMAGMAGALALLNIATKGLNAGTAARMVLGVGLIGLVAAGMAWEGKKIINYLKDLKMDELGRAGLALGAIGTFFLVASGVALASAAIGAIALGGGGVGALAIGAGVLVLAAIVEGMTKGVIRIMNQINQFRPQPGFIEKTKAFVSIIEAVGRFAGSIATIVAAVSPGITGLIGQVFFGTNPQQEMERTLGQVRNIIDALGSQMTNIIQTVQRSINSMPGGPEDLRKAEVLGGLLNGVAELAKAMSPPTEALAEPGIFATLFQGATTVRNVGAVSDYIGRLDPVLRNILTRITNIIEGLPATGINEQQKTLIEVIPGMLKGIGDLAQALLPRNTTLEQIQRGTSFSGALTNIGQFMHDLLDNIVQTGLFEQIGNTIAAVAGALTHAGSTPAQLQVLKAGLPAITAGFTGIGNIAMAIANLAQGNAAQTAGNIFQATQFVSTLLNSISGQLPQVVRTMATSFSGINAGQISNAAKGIEGIGQIIGTVSHIDFEHLPNTAALRDMITKVNEISTTLATLQPINIAPQFRRLANIIQGQGSNTPLQFRNFTMEVHFDVHLDARELEAALTASPGTNILHIRNGT